MNLVPVSVLLPKKARHKFACKYQLLANDQDYLGLGTLAGEPGAQHWLMATGDTLPLEAVTYWGTLMSVPLLTRQTEVKDLLDEDGYPTAYALSLLEQWSWVDPVGWFRLAESIWQHKSMGFGIFEEPTKWSVDASTLGWGGNESLIRSMQKNEMLWGSTWKSSRVGGHFVFEFRKQERDEEPATT